MTAAQPYIIKAEPLPERYARGWHCLGKASDFSEKPVMLNYFGTRLVAYRGDNDQVHILDGYCPHMGADLSKGHVEGDNLICPFHGWSWGSDGVCNHIPYAKRVPSKAVIKSWPTLEKNGLVFVWNDPDSGAPIPEQEPQRIDDWYSGEWTDWTMTLVDIHSNCRELVDNMADRGHFGPVHFTDVRSFRNVQDGHTFVQYMTGGHAILEDGSTGMTSIATYEGPAYMTTTMTGSMEERAVTVHLAVTHVPVDMNHFHIRLGVMMKKFADLDEAENQRLVEAYTQLCIESFQQDVEIWDNKVRVDNPVLCDGDGPINMVRKWYSQFYLPVDQVPEDLTRHKEHVTL